MSFLSQLFLSGNKNFKQTLKYQSVQQARSTEQSIDLQ